MLRRTILILLAFALPAWGAMDFNGTTDKADGAAAELTDEPISMMCLFDSDSATAHQVMLALDAGGTTQMAFRLVARGDQVGDPIHAIAQDSLAEVAATSTGYSTGTWHAAGALFTSDTSRTAYIDGGSSGSNTNSKAVTDIDSTSIAYLEWDSGDILFFDGSLAECGIWDGTLSIEQFGSITDGTNNYAAHCIRPEALVGDYPMIRDSGSLKDHAGEPNNLTLTGGTVSTHPRVTNCQ